MRLLFAAILVVILTTNANSQQAKKPYFIRISIQKLKLGNDSMSYRSPKTFYLECGQKSDTIEVGALKNSRIGMSVEVQKYFQEKTVRYRFAYSFFKRENNKWVLIKTFPWVDRFSLVKKPDEIKKSQSKVAAKEEYFCQGGEPFLFSATFKMDVYLNSDN
jgi:hypothetical protein